MECFKVLFHVNENDRWPVVITNIGNFLKDVGQENAEVEVVANGAAVWAFASDSGGELLERMKQLAARGVRFAACRNAINAHALNESALPPFVAVVSAGITEIARKQCLGYAYIKP